MVCLSVDEFDNAFYTRVSTFTQSGDLLISLRETDRYSWSRSDVPALLGGMLVDMSVMKRDAKMTLYVDGCAALEEALQIDPQHPNASRMLGQVQRLRGQKAIAAKINVTDAAPEPETKIANMKARRRGGLCSALAWSQIDAAQWPWVL